MNRVASAVVLAALAAPGAHAAIVHVRVTGSVESNAFVTGALAGVPAGAPVLLEFDVDSGVFLDSPNLPGRTRGYTIINNSFSLRIGTVNCPLLGSPVARFVIRNNDPRVDGVFLSTGTDLPVHIPLNIGVTGMGVYFLRTFNGAPPPPSTAPDPTFPSLNILECLGSWGFNNLSVYGFDIRRNDIQTPLIIAYETLAISSTPPACRPDFNGDGRLDPDDLSDYITCYFSVPACAGADFNIDGSVDPDDLSDFITAYFHGC